MANHPYNQHREQQVAHRRVNTILSGSPAGAKKHASGHAFSKITSKSAASSDDEIRGKKVSNRFARGGRAHSDEAEDRKLIRKMMAEHEKGEGENEYARGGKVKGKGNSTTVNIVVPGGGPKPPLPIVPPGPPGLPPGGPPMPPMGGPPPGGLPPGGPPPGLPMRAAGGRIKKSGAMSKAMIAKSAARAKANSFFTGGAATGVGREEKAEHMKRRK